MVSMAPVIPLSAFINNTPVVAVMIPVLLGLARRISARPSKLLMPSRDSLVLPLLRGGSRGPICSIGGRRSRSRLPSPRSRRHPAATIELAWSLQSRARPWFQVSQ
jgi:hypothetical protein